jgi:hypothetical protein
MYEADEGKNQAKICGEIHKNREIFIQYGSSTLRMPG